MIRIDAHAPSRFRRFTLCAAIAACIHPAVGAGVADIPLRVAVSAHPDSSAYLRLQNARARLAPPHPTGGIVVHNCDDSGPGSLREAYTQADGNFTIDLSQMTCSRITLTTGALVDSPNATAVLVTAPLLIDVDYVSHPTMTIDAGGTDRAFVHNGTGVLSLAGLRVTNGRAAGTDEHGGCILSRGQLAMNGAVVDHCATVASGVSVGKGGAMYSAGETLLVDSIISGNAVSSAAGYSSGGAIYSKGVLVVIYSSIDGNEAAGLGQGGGAFAAGGLLLRNSTVSNNRARYDGALTVLATTNYHSIIDSTIAFNTASGMVGGIETLASLEIDSSTIAFNTGASTKRTGGLYALDPGVVTLNNTIVADNTAAGMPADVAGQHPLLGSHNIVVAANADVIPADTLRTDPRLGPLLHNGGPTLTMAPGTGSPAIDAGLIAQPQLEATDQRAGLFRRMFGPAPDIGSIEVQPVDRIFIDGFDGIPQGRVDRSPDH